MLGGLVVLSLLLRAGGLDGSLWTDEGISAGIASHDLDDIPGTLRQDGAPPLYYLLLHAWTAVAGSGEVALRGLSLGFALALVPTACWAGRSLFGSRAGWIAAALAATSPFLTTYAREGRMYTLVALLSLLAAVAFVKGIGEGRTRWAGAFGALLALLLYTHAWAVLFAGGALASALALRARPRDLALGFGLPAVLFAPWLPTLAFQARHTGAPWSNLPGPFPLVQALALAVVAALLARLAPDEGRRRALLALGALVSVTLAFAWTAAHLERMWADRYLAVLAGPLLLLAGAGLARLGKAGLALAALACALWALEGPPGPKTNVAVVAARTSTALRSGDTVLATQPELVPVLAYYLSRRAGPGRGPRGLSWASALGPVADPRVMDWRDALARLRSAPPGRLAGKAVARMAPGQRLALVRPHTADARRWRAPWTRLVRLRSSQWAVQLERDRRLRRVAVTPGPGGDTDRTSVSAVVYERRKGMGP